MTDGTPAARRDDLHALVDALPEGELDEARRFLGALGEANPSLRAALLAPMDDEPFADEECAAVGAAEAAYRRGEWVSDEEVRREYGW